MRALVLSAGSSKGAFQAGALQHILGELQINYDIFCGVSAGAINCAFLSMFKSGEEKKAALQLKKMWLSIDNSKIYKKHFPFGRLHALWGKSIYDSSPLNKLIRQYLSLDKIRENGRKVTAGTVSLSSGKYTIFDETSDHFIDAVIAGASFPGIFEPVSFLGQLWTDGGIKEMSSIKKAIELGATVIDVIITSPQTRINHFIKNPTVVDILKRSFDLSTDKIMANDIEKVQMHNLLAEFGVADKKYVKINILRPEVNLIDDLLDFNPDKIKNMIKIGYNNAVRNFKE